MTFRKLLPKLSENAQWDVICYPLIEDGSV